MGREIYRRSRLVCFIPNGAVETILSCYGKGEAVDKAFSFLNVALRGIAFQAVGNIAKIGLPISIIGKGAGQFAFFTAAETKFCFIVSV